MAVVGVLLAACGGDGGSDGSVGDIVGSASGDGDEGGRSGGESGGGGAGEEAYVEAVAASMTGDEEIPVDEATATCMATAIVDLVGVEALQQADVTPEEFRDAGNFDEVGVELPDDATNRLTDGLAGCEIAAPFREVVTDQFESEMGSELPSEATLCLDTTLDDRTAAAGLASAFIDGSGDVMEQLFLDTIVACPEVMTAIVVAEAPRALTPEEEECIGSVIAANPEVVREGISGEGDGASQELGGLIAANCPSAVG
jgi:hypothetical protein